MRNMMLLILQNYVLSDAEVLAKPCIYELMTEQHVHWKLNLDFFTWNPWQHGVPYGVVPFPSNGKSQWDNAVQLH
ncbi:hypothetical protein D5086_020731 [Populus alba]|uniref:Uncharacterized protein n=1 Tax=Populus alba TaxID=43335 RepID=A0ACC4BLI3_POPAL